MTIIDKKEVEINANVLIRLLYFLHGPFEWSSLILLVRRPQFGSVNYVV